MKNSSVEIYRSPKVNIELNVKLENDTVWLSANQMAALFYRDENYVYALVILDSYDYQNLTKLQCCYIWL